MAKAKRTTRKTAKKPAKRQPRKQRRIEATLTPEQLDQLSKEFAVHGVASLELPVSPNAIIKVKGG